MTKSYPVTKKADGLRGFIKPLRDGGSRATNKGTRKLLKVQVD